MDLALDKRIAAAKKSGAYRILSKFDSLMDDHKFRVKVAGIRHTSNNKFLTYFRTWVRSHM